MSSKLATFHRLALIVAALAMSSVGCNQQDLDDAEQDAMTDVEKGAADAGKAAGKAFEDMKKMFGEGFAAASEKASAALKDVEGGDKILTDTKQFFASAYESLKGITDKASAEAAGPALDKLNSTADELAQDAEQLPGKAKTALQRVFEEGSKQIKDLIEKVKSNPEVANVIQPKLEEMMNKLKSLTGDTAA